MHEIGLVQDIISVINSKLKDLKTGAKLKAVNIVIGELEHLTADHFEFHFREHTKGTLLENAKLNFKKEKAMLKCKDCGTEFLFDPSTRFAALLRKTKQRGLLGIFGKSPKISSKAISLEETTPMSCPKCASRSNDIIKGMQVYVESIEVG